MQIFTTRIAGTQITNNFPCNFDPFFIPITGLMTLKAAKLRKF